MKRAILNYLVIVAFVVSTSFVARTANAGQISMTINPTTGDASFCIGGNGTITIDWGDGTESANHSLVSYEQWHWNYNPEKYVYRHTYSDTLAKLITITGENITHLRCGSFLLNLDVSKNPALIWLSCGWDINLSGGNKKIINLTEKR